MIETFGTPTTTKLSKNEQDVLKAIGSKHLIELVNGGQLVAPNAFDCAALDAFMENKQGPAVEALRRMVIACKKMSPLRGTPEYIKLCQYE